MASIATVKKITSWSFSRWQLYEECPRRAQYKFIDKMQEPSGPALERGTALHELAEQYLRGLKARVPAELKLIGDTLKDYKKRKAVPEAEFSFTNKWVPTSWFGQDAWCRVKADVTIAPNLDKDGVVEVHDFKSGKIHDGSTVYGIQLELYALAALLAFPIAKKTKTSLVFIDHGVTIPIETEYTQKDVSALKKGWEKRVKAMLNDERFAPNPGNACRWCHFRKNRGGPCEY